MYYVHYGAAFFRCLGVRSALKTRAGTSDVGVANPSHTVSGRHCNHGLCGQLGSYLFCNVPVVKGSLAVISPYRDR